MAPPALSASSPDEIANAYRKGQLAWDQGDIVGAMALLKLPADSGNAAAQALLGYILDQADNDNEAANYYRMAAAQSNPEGMFGLALFHSSGDGGVKVDIGQARQLYLRAAEAGHRPSIDVIITSYINGGLGLTDEERKGPGALKWFRTGEQLNSIPAIEQLVDAHRTGKFGLTPDPAEAERLQAKIYAIMGIDPSTIKKKRRPK